MRVERLNTTLKIRKVSTQSTQSLLQMLSFIDSIRANNDNGEICEGNAFLLPYCYTKVRMSHGKGVASNADIVFILMVFIKNWLDNP